MALFVIDQDSKYRTGKLFDTIHTPCWSPLVDTHVPKGLLYNEIEGWMAPLLLTSNLTLTYDKATKMVSFSDAKISKNKLRIILVDDYDPIYVIIKCNEDFLTLLKDGNAPMRLLNSDSVPKAGSYTPDKRFRWISVHNEYNVNECNLSIYVKKYIKFIKNKRSLYETSNGDIDDLAGFEYKINEETVGEDIVSILGVLPADSLRLVTLTDGSYKSVLKIVSFGFDVIITDYPTRLSERGLALLPYKDEILFDTNSPETDTTAYTIDLNDVVHADDYINKLTDTSPRQETRGYIHHLLKCNEPLGMVILQLHNTYTYEDFFKTLRINLKTDTANSI